MKLLSGPSNGYREVLEQRLQDRPHKDEDTRKKNWDTLKDCIVTAAEEVLGKGRRKQPERFRESYDILIPLVEAKNRALQRALQSNTTVNQKEFKRQQRLMKRAVDKAKEDWICRVAKEAEVAVKDGHTSWDRIRRDYWRLMQGED
ncbi:uncharacterized protein LOC134191212 [Corticium candelabrum]|uniref:uncharacterized protein LOC134191212 n=1 Tax=Corticium candelabrum TaxID=121492 RepID=UPI002E2646DA|nr:uncharacterized protein LOC134191212 [Corticium candelabrum]